MALRLPPVPLLTSGVIGRPLPPMVLRLPPVLLLPSGVIGPLLHLPTLLP